LVLVIPLVLAPYLSRTLRETALGIFSYANSIAAYFVTLSMLGIARHGQRIISENANNNIKLRKAFWSLFVVHIIVSVISIILYSLFVVFFIKSDRVVFRIEILYVASALFDITWLFYGLENFKSVVIKNTLIKIFECAFVFIFVKSPNDLGIYTFINASAILISQAIMLPQAIKAVRPIRFNKDDAKEHIKPLLVFSISVIASFMYTVFDKTLLGIMSTKESVAFYEYSNRIVSVPKTIIGVTGTVMFPRACRLAAEGNIIGQRKYIKYSYLAAYETVKNFVEKDENIEKTLKVAEELAEAYRKGNKSLIAGNGGSNCDAMHFAEEFTGRFRKDRKALPSLSISDSSHITCVGNDYGFNFIFAKGVEAFGKEGDFFFGISTSGNSRNVIEAVKIAKEKGLKTVGILGKDGGKMKGMCDYEFIVPGETTDRIQEVHMMILHIIIEGVERILFPENY